MDQEQPHIEPQGTDHTVTENVAPAETVNPNGEMAPVDATTAPMEDVGTSRPNASAEERKARSREGEGWLSTVQSLMVTVTIAVFVITFVVQAFEIPSPSMEKTLLIGDYLLVDKTHYGPGGAWKWILPYRKIQRGDIVVFHYPRDPKQHFVKRVIGLPGDRIRMHHKTVYVNGKPLTEPYAVFSDRSEDVFRDDFPMGNRLQENIDSSWYLQMDRLVEDGQLIVPADHYFVMGDNRDDSSDSRYWGFVPKENIVGRPLLIYFSMGSTVEDGVSSAGDGDERQGGKLSLRTVLSRIAHDIRWRRVLRLVN